jgi:hypothetical protein
MEKLKKLKKSRLNECACCGSNVDLEPELSTARGLFFFCRNCAALDRLMWKAIINAPALREEP